MPDRNPTTAKKIRFMYSLQGTARPHYQCLHSYICEHLIYSHDWPTYFPAAKEADRSWEYIIRSQIMNVEIRIEVAQFPFWEYFVLVFGPMSL